MSLYQLTRVVNGFVKENFFREADDIEEIWAYIRDFESGHAREWRVELIR